MNGFYATKLTFLVASKSLTLIKCQLRQPIVSFGVCEQIGNQMVGTYTYLMPTQFCLRDPPPQSTQCGFIPWFYIGRSLKCRFTTIIHRYFSSNSANFSPPNTRTIRGGKTIRIVWIFDKQAYIIRIIFEIGKQVCSRYL